MLFNQPERISTLSTTSDTSRFTRKDGLRIVVPIQNEEQGRLAVNVLKSNSDQRFSLIRLFHCREDNYTYTSWINPMEVIQLIDSREEDLQRSQSYLRRFAQELATAFPDTRVSYNSVAHTSVSTAIAEEAELFEANLILLINDPARKKHWLFPGISNRLLRTAKCPVQVIKPAQGSPQDGLVFVA